MQKPDWLALAKTLPAGGKRKIVCCGKDASMLVSNGRKGYSAHCFRCDRNEFIAHGMFSIDDLKRRREEAALLQNKTIQLPKDLTLDIPTDEAVWLYRAGISDALARAYGFGYSPFLRRVILPVYDNQKLIGYTARTTIPNMKPKYIEKADSDACFFSDPSLILPSSASSEALSLYDAVVVEDILSAVRVGRCVRCACSLMGTSASDAQMEKLLRATGKAAADAKVLVWLDPDGPGIRAARRLVQSLRLAGTLVEYVRSGRDPKYYSYEDIRSYITGDRRNTPSVNEAQAGLLQVP